MNVREGQRPATDSKITLGIELCWPSGQYECARDFQCYLSTGFGQIKHVSI